MSTLIVKCPHCAAKQEDTWDVLGEGRHELQCAECRTLFTVHLVECPRCAADNIGYEDSALLTQCTQCRAALSGEEFDDRH